MKRLFSSILVIGLLLNVVIPVYASDTLGDEELVGGFWSKLRDAIDAGCATLGLAAAVTGGLACAAGGPTTVAICAGCAGWGFVRTVSSLAG